MTYWKCNCKINNIHPVCVKECKVCGSKPGEKRPTQAEMVKLIQSRKGEPLPR